MENKGDNVVKGFVIPEPPGIIQGPPTVTEIVAPVGVDDIEKVAKGLKIQGFPNGTRIEVALVENGYKMTIYKGEVGKR